MDIAELKFGGPAFPLGDVALTPIVVHPPHGTQALTGEGRGKTLDQEMS